MYVCMYQGRFKVGAKSGRIKFGPLSFCLDDRSNYGWLFLSRSSWAFMAFVAYIYIYLYIYIFDINIHNGPWQPKMGEQCSVAKLVLSPFFLSRPGR